MWKPPEMESLQDTSDAMHEYYLSLKNSGFTRHEAFHLILGVPMCCDDQ